jgi:hypothetical protein
MEVKIMPTLTVTTKTARQVWASPDGQRVIYEVGLDYNGNLLKGKTYSNAIAAPGWSGVVESYEKQGRNGVETFVKQPPKEQGGYEGSRSAGASREKDPFTMYLSYAKDLLVSLVETKGYAEKAYNDLLEAVIHGGNTLYQGRPGAEEASEKTTTTVADVIAPVHEGESMSFDDVKGVFDQEDTPWPSENRS